MNLKIGRTIKRQRKLRDMTLTDLANKSGISKGLLSRIENYQDQNPSLNTLVKVANAFRIPASTLLWYAKL